jgi:transcriptional regulator GlxA family with amidase domain
MRSAKVWLECTTAWLACPSHAHARCATLILVSRSQADPRETLPFQLASAHTQRAHPAVADGSRSSARELSRSSGAQLPWLDPVSEYIEVNLHQSLTVMELAGVAGVSPTHFSRLFRQAMGESPYRYVRRRRVDRAEQLIVGTQLPFRDIARLVGFSDQSHLNRMMRAERGLTPGHLRQTANSVR